MIDTLNIDSEKCYREAEKIDGSMEDNDCRCTVDCKCTTQRYDVYSAFTWWMCPERIYFSTSYDNQSVHLLLLNFWMLFDTVCYEG